MLKFISQSISKFVLMLLYIILTPLMVSANPTYAKLTGQPCSTCHIDPGGGGANTTIGLIFLVSKSILLFAIFALAIYIIIRILRHFKSRNDEPKNGN